MSEILFKETQKNIIIVVIFGLVTLLFAALAFVQMGFHHIVGNHPAPNWLLILFFVLGAAATVFFYFQQLKLTITAEETQVSFGLLTGKTEIKTSDIKNIRLRKYNARSEFMGWGARYNEKGSCFTVSGSDGMEIELNNGELILIGTHKTAELQVVMDKHFASKTPD